MLYVASDRLMREFPGSILPPFLPCDWEDAAGNVIKHPNGGPATIILVDTDTGKVIQYQARMTAKGTQEFVVEDLAGGLKGVTRIHMRYPAPIKCIPMPNQSEPTSRNTPFTVLPVEPIEIVTNGHSHQHKKTKRKHPPR
jgi:hypothetical protein